MASQQLLKQRIKSIKVINKITKAMQMIASAKLVKMRKQLNENLSYANGIKEVVDDIIFNAKGIENKFLKENKSNRSFVICFSNDLGMCGSYTSKLNNYLKNKLKDDDIFVLVGYKSFSLFENRNLLSTYDSDSFKHNNALEIGNVALSKFLSKEVGSIKIIYTEFINNMNFEPKEICLLPYENNKDRKKTKQEIIFEPNVDDILNNLIPLMLNNLIYSTYLRSKTSEQAARRLAMENASDNAEELKEELTLTYNQARQQAITQEITEIVAGSNL